MKSVVAMMLAVAAVALMPSANAADLPAKAPAAPLAAPYNWTGLYVGVNGGYGTGDTTGPLLPTFFFGNHNIDGGLFGGQIGFNYQVGHIVLGVEADWDWADINGSQSAGGLTEKATVKDLGTLRGRIGYAWDRTLIYGTGGFAWSSRVRDECATCGLAPDTQSLNGYTLGLGVEYGLTPNLSAKLEYLYVDLDADNFYGSQGCFVSCGLGARINVVRLGLNWRFSRLGF